VRIVLHYPGDRKLVIDEAPFEESKHPRAGNGQFGSGGGGSSSSSSGPTAHASAVHKALETKIKGSSAERVALRALLKDPNTKGELKSQLQAKIIHSFATQHGILVKKDATKAAEIAAKTAEYAKKYGQPNPLAVKTAAQANQGYSPQVQAQAQAVMKAELPKPSSGSFTPQEVADFNDLVALSGEMSAKEWTAFAKEKTKQHSLPMSAGECAHIVAYSSHAYKKTNAELRAGVMDESTWKHVSQLNGALDKLPKHKGVVSRKTSLTAEQFALYQPGKIVEERGFTSTSKNPGTWTGSHRFVVTSKSGRDIQRISKHPDEAEVLFKSGTRFKITKKTGNEIHMEEVDGR
jgi:hypothetical protein